MRLRDYEPGELFKGEAKRARKAKPDKDERHCAAVRRINKCVGCGSSRDIEAAHIRMSNGPEKPNPGMGQKPPDRYVTPLCHQCHMEQHSMGERAWWRAQGLDPFAIADELYRVTPDSGKMLAIIIRIKEGLL